MTSSPDLSWVSSPSTRAITFSSSKPTTMPARSLGKWTICPQRQNGSPVMLAMAFLTPMTVPISRVSKVWERNLSRETLSNIGEHPLHLGFETPVQNHVPQPDHHAGHDLPVDDLLDVDRPSHVRREDRVQPFALRLGERKRNGDFDRLGLELRSWPVGLPDLLDELVDQMRVDGLSHRGREDAPEDVRRQGHGLFFHFRDEAYPHPLPLGLRVGHDTAPLLLRLRYELFLHLPGGRLRLGSQPPGLLLMPGHRCPKLPLRLVALPLQLLLPLPVLLVELL